MVQLKKTHSPNKMTEYYVGLRINKEAEEECELFFTKLKNLCLILDFKTKPGNCLYLKDIEIIIDNQPVDIVTLHYKYNIRGTEVYNIRFGSLTDKQSFLERFDSPLCKCQT